MRKLLFLLMIFYSVSSLAANRYEVRYCYVKDGRYSSWRGISGSAVGGRNSEGKISLDFYWRTQTTACFSILITSIDGDSMSKKERKRIKKAHKPFKGYGIVRYCTFSGRFNFENFPGGDAFPFMGSPKGEWVTSQAKFELYQYENHDEIRVFFDNYEFAIALYEYYGTFY